MSKRLKYINDLSKGIDNQILCMDVRQGLKKAPDNCPSKCWKAPKKEGTDGLSQPLS